MIGTTHPLFQKRFRQLTRRVTETRFNDFFLEALGQDQAELNEQWQLYVMQAEYGYDVARAAIGRRPAEPWKDTVTLAIAADRGWQSTGVILQTGTKYRIEAAGRFQIAKTTKPWICEPQGVTIRYHGGLPKGNIKHMNFSRKCRVSWSLSLVPRTKSDLFGGFQYHS